MADLLNNETFRLFVSTICVNLFLTLIIEVPLAFALGVRKFRDIETVIYTNCISNPLVITIFFLMLHFQVAYAIMNCAIIAMEILAVLCEGLVYRKHLPRGKLSPFALSLILNAASFGFGIVLDLLGL